MFSHIVLTFRYSSGSHLTLILRTSLSTNSSTRAAQIVVEFDGVDAGGGAVGKSVKKSSKSCQKVVKKVGESSKSPKSFKGLKNL